MSKEIGVVITFYDPMSFVIKAFLELYGNKYRVKIQFNPDIAKDMKPPYGVTIFPDDKSTPVIEISPNIPYTAILEILIHELAHIVMGPKSMKHGNEWNTVYQRILKKYNIVSRR